MSSSITDTFLSYHFELTPEEARSFEHFLDIFIEYNHHTNLSAIRERDDIIIKHCIDSLQWVPYITQYCKENNISKPKLIDIGSGGWFPWIPLKIALPELSVTLLDSVGKKVKAMEYFIQALTLRDIEVAHGRAEVLGWDRRFHEQYTVVVSRATAYVTSILPWCVPFLHPDGKVLLYKTPSQEEKHDMERIMHTLSLELEDVFRYTLAGWEREIFIFTRAEY